MEKANIKVYNYCGSFIGVAASSNKSIGFDGMRDGIPGMEVLSYEEIEYINSHTNVFRNGRLEFDEADRDELFDMLRINGKATLYERDIDDLISNWSEDHVRKILEIESLDTIERVRGHVMTHKNRGDIDIPIRMADLVTNRYKELSQGRVKSRISVVEGTEPVKQMVSMEEVEKLLAQQKAAFMAEIKEYMGAVPAKEETETVKQESSVADSVSEKSEAVDPIPAKAKTTTKTTKTASTTKKTTTHTGSRTTKTTKKT